MQNAEERSTPTANPDETLNALLSKNVSEIQEDESDLRDVNFKALHLENGLCKRHK